MNYHPTDFLDNIISANAPSGCIAGRTVWDKPLGKPVGKPNRYLWIWGIILAVLLIGFDAEARDQDKGKRKKAKRSAKVSQRAVRQAARQAALKASRIRRFVPLVNQEGTGNLFQQAHYESPLYVPPSFGLPTGAKGLQPGGATTDPLDFNYGLKRGTNLSHWLSQSTKRGEERAAYLTEQDISWLGSIGLDHVRLPIDEVQLWHQDGSMNDTTFLLMHKAIGWCMARNMKVIVDLHIIKSHYFNAEINALWTSEAAQTHMIELWRDLSEALKGYPNAMLAYEMMNEPVAPDPEQWNKLVAKLHQSIRAHEPDRWIVIGSNMWQTPETFDLLKVPEGDRRLILSFHFYEPFFLTHYKANWVPHRDWAGRVRYPGFTFQLTDTIGQNPALVGFMKQHYKFWDARAIDQMLAKPIALSRKLNLPLYCGEWGCYQKTPMPDRLRWYQDMRRVFELHRIPWATWDYKGSFGLKLPDGTPCQEILVVLLDAPIKR